MLKFRPTAKLFLEQPCSSWMFKMPEIQPVIAGWGLKKHLTYLGSWGHNMWKPTHIMSNVDFQIARKGTRALKLLFTKRIEKKKARMIAAGKPLPEYYIVGANGSFTGGKDLQSSAVYPQRFVTRCYSAWLQLFRQQVANQSVDQCALGS